jgi:peptide/nickel transport system ATP-binding protein
MRINSPRAFTRGDVRLNGRDMFQLSEAEFRTVRGAEIGMVFQNPMTSLNPVTRIGSQLVETLRLHSKELSKQEARNRAVALLRDVGIPDPTRRVQEYPHQLSGGMRQRVCIALAVSCGPSILLADEPTTALDVTFQRQVLDLLMSLQAQNEMALVLVTHDFGLVATRADRVLVMYAGRVIETGPTKTIFQTTRHPYTASLLASIPRVSAPSRKRLSVIPGPAYDPLHPPAGCRFAPRCGAAQARCLLEEPILRAADDRNHGFACFYPVGTPAGEEALRANRAAGWTAAGVKVDAFAEVS